MNLGEPGSRFRAAAPNHPETLLEKPLSFSTCWGKMSHLSSRGTAPEISTVPDLFFFRLPPQVRWNLYVEPCGTSTFNSGTFLRNFAEHTLVRVEPQLLRVESLCGTVGRGEPELLRLEP